MVRRSLTITIATVLVLSLIAFGTTAFTSATIERQANIDVVADDSGPIALGSGGTGISKIDSNGELVLDVSDLSSASGINPNASYRFGDPGGDDLSNSNLEPSDYVFTITNNADSSKTINLQFNPDSGSLNAQNVNFTVYRMGDGGTTTGALATVQADGTQVSFTANAGTTYHVVATFDSGVDGADVTKAGDLSGTLTLSV